MTADERRLFVPLKSNATQLVAGAPAASVRRKLKFASVAYDRLLLEGGALSIDAGESGAFTGTAPYVEFQTAAERRAGMLSGFSLSMGVEDTPGVAADPGEMRTVMTSATSAISWRPTLAPFADELPNGCDWVDWVSGPRDPEVTRIASQWAHRDRNNGALLSAVPVSFARSLIIDHSNSDLARAALSGVAVMQDATHRQVVASRLDSSDTWQPTGFAVPVLAPKVGSLSWNEIHAVRNQRAMRSYRAVLRDLEAEALQESSAGADLERLLHVGLHDRLAKLAEPPSGAASVLFGGVQSFFVGAGIGAATAGWTGTAGIFGGAAIGMVVDIGREAVNRSRTRAARSWLSLHQQLNE